MSSPTWSRPRPPPSSCGPTRRRVRPSTPPPPAAVSQPLRPCRAPGFGQTGCQPARPVSSTAPAALGFSTTVLNATSVPASWQLLPQPEPIQGFKLFHRKLPAAHFEGPLLLPSNVSSFLYTHLGEARTLFYGLGPGTELPGPGRPVPFTLPLPTEPAALYEIKLQAFNGNGDGDSSARFVSLRDVLLVTAGEWGPVRGS